METSIENSRAKNSREWIWLFCGLFSALNIAGVQYGIMLAAAPASNPIFAHIAVIRRFGLHPLAFLTRHKSEVFHGLLAATILSLLITVLLAGIYWYRAIRPVKSSLIQRK